MAWAAVDPVDADRPSMLAIGAPRSEHHLCQQIPGCNYRKSDDIWRAPLTWTSYVAMHTVWGDFPLSESAELRRTAEWQYSQVLRQYELRSVMDASSEVAAALNTINLDFPDGPHLRPFQRGGVQWLVEGKPKQLLTDPRGNGKSPQVIRAIQCLKLLGREPLPVLIICTGAMQYGWLDEFRKWASELTVQVVGGSAIARRKALDAEADVYVMSWPTVRLHTRLASYPGQAFVRCPEHDGEDEKITAPRCEVHPKELNDRQWGTVVADEAHRMGDARSKQTRAVWYLMHGARYAWPVTGTPVGDNISQLWALLHGVDPVSFPSRSRYLDLFAEKDFAWNGGAQILGIRPDTEKAFHAITQPLMRRIPRDLARPEQPPVLDPVFRRPLMTPAQGRVYKQLAKELLADLEHNTIVPASAAARFGRLCQLASASIELQDGEDPQGFTSRNVRMCLPSSKIDDLFDFLAGEDPADSLVVAANSPHLIRLAEAKLAEHKITCCSIIGGMTNEAKWQAAQWFQGRQCRVILINEAGSESITLTAASTIYFMQPDPVFTSREQKIGRLDRFTQQFPVRVIYSIAPGTVEQGLHELGNEKESRADSVTRDADLMRWIVTGEDHDAAE